MNFKRAILRKGTGRLTFMSAAVVAAVVAVSGCSTYDATQARRDHTESFTNDLARLSVELLARPLSLDECIRIAMTNNYQVRQADLRTELNRIGKNVAFTAFLPNVAGTAGYTSYAKQPNVMTERRFNSADLEIGMPIFMPSTWFLYAAARHGYATAATAAYYVRQGIVLQTTMDYCETLLAQETVAALETQLKAALENAERIEGLAGEGFFRPWEAEQARLLAETRQAELNHARRQLEVKRGELLVGLGLAPGTAVELSGEMAAPVSFDKTTEELVLVALQENPSLALSDRQVVIQEHRVREAFCAFLPTLSIFTSGTWTGNSLADHSANWISGLKGAWTLFDGLANVARYRAAKVEKKQAVFEREAAFLNVMIQVIAAEAKLRDATETTLIRERSYDVLAAKYDDYDARSREGLIPLSDALDARAAMDEAQVELLRSKYLERLASASLELAIGTTVVPGDK